MSRKSGDRFSEKDMRQSTTLMSAKGVGASVARKEDDRFLRGRGQYVADFRFPGIRDVAFVRSAIAHGRIRAIHVPPGLEGAVFTAARPGRRQADPRGHGVARLQAFVRADPGGGQGALRGRDRRHVRRRLACRGRGHRRAGDGRLRRIAGRERHAGGAPRRLRARSRGLGRQRLHRVFRGRRGGARGRDRRHQGHARNPHGAALHAADRRARSGRLLRPAARLSHGDHREPDAARGAARHRRVPGPGGWRGPRHLSRRRRRLRLQGPAEPRGGRAGVARAAQRRSRALDRGLPRASDRQRELPGASLSHHRLCGSRRTSAGARLRGQCRRRRLLGLSDLLGAGGGPDRQPVAGSLRFLHLSLPRRGGGDQQVPDPPVPRGCPHRRVPGH